MPHKSRLNLEELEKMGLVYSRHDSRTTTIFKELMVDSQDLPAIGSGSIADEDLERIGETIMPVNVTNFAFLNMGGWGIVYLGLQHPIEYVSSRDGLENQVLREEFNKSGGEEFARVHDVGFLERLFVSKYLFGGLKNLEKARVRFRREGKILEKLKHPRVPHAIHADNNVIVSRYFPHTITLERLIDTGQRTIWERAKIAEHTAKIFAELQEQAEREGRPVVFHRDIKPSNILVYNPAIDDLNAFVIDWGIASDPELPDPEIQGNPKVTDTGVLEGTPYYMAPEVAIDDLKAYDIRSESYCLGTTLYHLLTGRTSLNSHSKINAVIFELLDWWYERGCEPPKPCDLNSEISPGLSAWIQKAMARKPEDRFQSMPELYHALQEEVDKLAVNRSTLIIPQGSAPQLVYPTDTRQTLIENAKQTIKEEPDLRKWHKAEDQTAVYQNDTEELAAQGIASSPANTIMREVDEILNGKSIIADRTEQGRQVMTKFCDILRKHYNLPPANRQLEYTPNPDKKEE